MNLPATALFLIYLQISKSSPEGDWGLISSGKSGWNFSDKGG